MKTRMTLLGVMFLLGTNPGRVFAEDAPSYSKDIVPYLKKYCIECHRPGKVKGGLLLDTYENILKGNNKGRKAVVPGDPDKSRVVMTTEHKIKPYMPPKKEKKQPTVKESEILRAWVKAGAKDDTAPAVPPPESRIPPSHKIESLVEKLPDRRQPARRED